ncbi:unnamed protein product [Eruca vesicaria subsp. sativa]|uniref:Uncharacterized protein n=1 Tax=Eruca vesicaria subsp. sativa TaxID=29727 RepID=A0ABC8JB90_ERUVS|nr:unnamed protein product [Eruca vesicaria subsp. sativa]
MGRVFRIWRGDWKKNAQDQWYFVLNHEDYGFTMYMDSPETFPVIDSTLREYYMLTPVTHVLITYGMPSWMLLSSGPSAPRTIASTSDLVDLISQRPPLIDSTLLCTIGAKSVAEFQFLTRSDFSIGFSTYVVGDGQDDIARARYEGLVLGERHLLSASVLTDIFGEEDMVIIHRVALEMAHADKTRQSQTGYGVVQRMEIIQLDDDDEMVDSFQNEVTENGT